MALYDFCIDDRIGSAFTKERGAVVDFVKPLRRLGLPVKVKSLRFADFAFTGNGPSGLCRVGIERKTVNEVLGSVGDDARLVSWQLPGMLKAYDFRFLVVEGIIKIDHARGTLQTGYGKDYGYTKDRHNYTAYKRFLLTLMLKGGFFVEPTSGFIETSRYLQALHGWFTRKAWDAHSAAYRVYENRPDSAILDERTFKRQMFAQLPGVLWKRSKLASEKFPSFAHAVVTNPDPDDFPFERWRKALGVKIGTMTIQGVKDVMYKLEQKSLRGNKT